MRTEAPRSSASAATATRLRRGVARARTWIRGRGRVARVALFAAAAAVALAAFLTIPLDREETLWLYDGRRFSADAALEIQKALAVEKVAFQSDSGHRIGVAASRWGAAMAALEKHGVAPPSLEEIESEPPPQSPWIGPTEKEEQDLWRAQRRLRATIEGFGGGIRSASVQLNRTRVHGGLRPEWRSGAVVMLDVERRPPHKVVYAIRTLLVSSVPGLSPDAVTIGDRAGNFYLDASNPKAAESTQSLARAEAVRDALLDKLAPLIPGIDVDVAIEPPAPTPAPAPIPRQAAAPIAVAEPGEGSKSNAPVGLDPDPAPEAHPVMAPTPPAPPGADRVSVWARVPRSYYLRVFREHAPNRPFKEDDRQVYQQKTRDLVENAVAMLVPAAERGPVRLDTIHDGLAAEPATVVAADPARSWPSWLAPAALGAGAGLGLALVLGTGFGLIASRRPSARPRRTSVRSGLSADAPSGPVPGPSERVRDLVRRDPEAAAGVLQRWIGAEDGGPAA